MTVVSVMNIPVSEHNTLESGEFEWEIEIPKEFRSYEIIKLSLTSNTSFVPKNFGINDDTRGLSILIHSIELK